MRKWSRDQLVKHWSSLNLSVTYPEPHTHFFSTALPSLLNWSEGLSITKQSLSTVQLLGTCCFPSGLDPAAYYNSPDQRSTVMKNLN